MCNFVLNTELVLPNNINATGYTNNIVSVVLNSQYEYCDIFIKPATVNHLMGVTYDCI